MKETLKIVFLAPLAIISLVFGSIDFCSKKISSSEEIKKVVEEEKKKIGIPHSVSIAVRNTPKYDFSIFGGYGGKTQGHEIFHVYRYLAIQDENDLYWYDEILARIYELFRINLSLKKI